MNKRKMGEVEILTVIYHGPVKIIYGNGLPPSADREPREWELLIEEGTNRALVKVPGEITSWHGIRVREVLSPSADQERELEKAADTHNFRYQSHNFRHQGLEPGTVATNTSQPAKPSEFFLASDDCYYWTPEAWEELKAYRLAKPSEAVVKMASKYKELIEQAELSGLNVSLDRQALEAYEKERLQFINRKSESPFSVLPTEGFDEIQKVMQDAMLRLDMVATYKNHVLPEYEVEKVLRESESLLKALKRLRSGLLTAGDESDKIAKSQRVEILANQKMIYDRQHVRIQELERELAKFRSGKMSLPTYKELQDICGELERENADLKAKLEGQ